MSIVYFFTHFLVEVVSFAILSRNLGDGWALLLSFMYDFFAFVPQGLIGLINAAHKRLDIGSIGCALMFAGVLLGSGEAGWRVFSGVFLVAVGNAFLHECGAVATVANGGGRLFPSALFVAGGSFGVVVGKYLAVVTDIPWIYLITVAAIEILVLVTNYCWLKEDVTYPEYDIVDRRLDPGIVIAGVVLITAVRSYIAYAIPISWNKEWWQTFLLFFMMGIGKGVGGLCADRYGAKRTGVVTSLAAIPFLVCGEQWMVISIMGVLLFSMTMSITYGMALSVLKKLPGVAFGVTTMGLFLGLLPTMFMEKPPLAVGNSLVVLLSGLAAFGFGKLCKSDKECRKERKGV